MAWRGKVGRGAVDHSFLAVNAVLIERVVGVAWRGHGADIGTHRPHACRGEGACRWESRKGRKAAIIIAHVTM